MISPDEVRDRASFHAAVSTLIRRQALATDEHAKAVAEAVRRGHVVQPHRRATMYGWGKDSLPQRNGGPFANFLLSRGIAVGDLDAWTEALERARATPAPSDADATGDGAGPPDAAGEVPGEEAAEETAEETPPASSPQPDAAPTPPSPADPPAAHGRQRRSGSRRRLLVGALAALVLVGGGLAVAWSATSASDSGANLDSALPSTTEEPFLREDFDERELAATKWNPPTSPQNIYADGRELNLVGATDRDPREIDVDLLPRNVPEFRQLDFVASIPDATRAGAGGAALTVVERGGRTHRLDFGPSPSDPPSRIAAALICSRASCRSYDDYDTPPPTRPFEYFAGDEVVPMRVLQNNGTLTFMMRGQVMATTPLDQPLSNFTFNAYSEPDERWRITVDAIRVYR